MKIIPYGKQTIDERDISEVVKVLRGDWITQGPAVEKFEKALATYCGSKYAVAVSNGTAALHLACLAAGLKRGDEAITTPITFLATPNSILYAGARPGFADIDYKSVNITASEISKKITAKTKALLPLHFAGLPCDIESIGKLAKKKKLTVIEDACHSLGAEYLSGGKWCKVGSCKHSDMTVFSFHPVKPITAGEGGAITTNDKKLYEKLLLLRSHGVTKTADMAKKEGSWYYEMQELGFNYRITDFQCALGFSQLNKINTFLSRRRAIADSYDKEFASLRGVETPEVAKDKKHAYHLYVLKIDFKDLGINRKKFFEELRGKGILPQVHYIPVYRQPYYAKKVRVPAAKNFPESEKYYERAVSIPIYPKMTDGDVARVSREIINALQRK